MCTPEKKTRENQRPPNANVTRYHVRYHIHPHGLISGTASARFPTALVAAAAPALVAVDEARKRSVSSMSMMIGRPASSRTILASCRGPWISTCVHCARGALAVEMRRSSILTTRGYGGMSDGKLSPVSMGP